MNVGRFFNAILCFVATAVWSQFGVAAQDHQPPAAFVLDSEAKSLAKIDVATARSLGTVTLDGNPEILLTPSSSSRVVVLDFGPGKPTVRFGYHPTGKSVATVIDSDAMKVIAKVELGWGLGSHRLTADGKKLVVFCPGYKSNNPKETLPGEFVTVDLENAAVERLAFERTPGSTLLTRNEETALVFTPREAGKKGTSGVPAQLQFIDVREPRVLSTLKLDGDPGAPALPPGGEFAYLLEFGKPSNKKDKNINGRLHVVSLETQRVEAVLDAGSGPRGLVIDEDNRQVLILSDLQGIKDKKAAEESGELRVVRGAALAATLKVAQSPLFVRIAPGRRHLHVLN